MTFQQLVSPFPWANYSKKLQEKIEQPKFVGFFTKEEGEKRDLRFVEATSGSRKEGNEVHLYFLVDKDDGIIVDVKYLAFGQSALVGALEAAAEMLIGKNYDQAKRLTTELLDRQVRDKSEIPAFPKETYPHLNLVLEAIQNGASQCTDLPLSLTYAAPPMPLDFGEVREGGYPGFDALSKEQKMTLIEEVLDTDVRPYIALDAGGVKLLDFLSDYQIFIAYEGSCTSCYSSVGTTLSFIQQVLRAKIHPNIKVTPELGNAFH